jgi:hypothetical protein
MGGLVGCSRSWNGPADVGSHAEAHLSSLEAGAGVRRVTCISDVYNVVHAPVKIIIETFR